MSRTDPRIDAYIKKAAPFARPILEYVREVMHATSPDIEETLRWGHPSFSYHGLLGGLAAFKEHAAFGFWKSALILDKDGSRVDEAFGSFGRLTSVKDLPAKRVLSGYIKKAMQLNEEGIAVPKKKTAPKPPPKAPPALQAALRKNRTALAHFEAFTPSKQRDYIDWITEAKTEATRDKRLATAIEWIAEGKSRNWKYENCQVPDSV